MAVTDGLKCMGLVCFRGCFSGFFMVQNGFAGGFYSFAKQVLFGGMRKATFVAFFNGCLDVGFLGGFDPRPFDPQRLRVSRFFLPMAEEIETFRSHLDPKCTWMCLWRNNPQKNKRQTSGVFNQSSKSDL